MASATTVERLRIRTSDTTRATPRRVAAAIRASHVAPAALPAGAVLVVRRLQLTVGDADGGSTGPNRWQRRLDDGVTAALKTAARPDGCVVDPAATAVLFDDEAHLLACALYLHLQGRERPWWAEHLRHVDGTVAVLLGHDPRLLPAVVDRLHTAGRTDRLVGALPADAARRMTAEVRNAFALPADATTPGAATTATGEDRGLAAPLPRTDRATSAAERLVAVALALVRRPAGPGGTATPPAGPAAPDRPYAPTTDTHARPAGGDVTDERVAGIPHGDLADLGSHPATRRPADAGPAGASQAGGDGVAGRSAPGKPERPIGVSSSHRTGDEPNDRATAPVDPDPTHEAEVPEARRTAAPPTSTPAVAPTGPSDGALVGVATGLAGVVYLIPLLGELSWLDDADPPWRADQVGGWLLIEAVARGLIMAPDSTGPTQDWDALAEDPLWRVLADLDGRDPDTPAPDMVPDAVVRGVGHRLAVALDVTPANAVAALRTPGRITYTTTHVDVVMALTDISLPVRLAGLDRTPGWVPHLRRVVIVTFRERP